MGHRKGADEVRLSVERRKTKKISIKQPSKLSEATANRIDEMFKVLEANSKMLFLLLLFSVKSGIREMLIQGMPRGWSLDHL